MYIRSAKHGTPSMYRHHKCRCVLCRTVWNERTQQYKIAKKLKRKRQIEAIFNNKI